MRIKWLAKASDDLNSQIDYIADRNPAAALDILVSIRAAVSRLENFSNSGRPGRQPGTRELPVVRTPFVIVYRTENSTVQILRVLHGAQKWSPAATEN